MSTQQIVPVTLQVGWATNYPAKFFIGDKAYNTIPNTDIRNGYWYIVVDRQNLNVVFNEMNDDNANYPSGLKPFLGSSQYYIFISTHDMRSDHLPVGELYTLLENLGATSNLSKALQIGNQIGTSVYAQVTYSIAADMSKQTVFDQYSYFQTDPLLVPLLFGAVEIDGKPSGC